MPKFSVIIPLYNKEKDIKKTLNSVFNQTFKDFELIIINDGSTDASEEIVKSVIDKRILLFSKKNEGVSKTRNFGVEKANTNYIVFLDADDYWYPNHLENLNSLITKFPNQSWYATAYEKKRNEKLITPFSSPIMEKGNNWYGLIEDFFKNCYIDSLTTSSSICMKKDFFNLLNGYDNQYTHGEDTDLWIRAALRSQLVFSNKISVRNNLDSSNRSSLTPIQDRNNIDLNKFNKEEKNNLSLKIFLDLNRYSLALKHKLSGNNSSFKKYVFDIDKKSLNKKQQFLLKQNKIILRLMLNFQALIEKTGLRLSSFK